MVLPKELHTELSHILKEFLKGMAKQYLPFENVNIDGVVCITNSINRDEEVVLKLHNQGVEVAAAAAVSRERVQVAYPMNNGHSHNHSVPSNDMPQDLRVRDVRDSARDTVRDTVRDSVREVREAERRVQDSMTPVVLGQYPLSLPKLPQPQAVAFDMKSIPINLSDSLLFQRIANVPAVQKPAPLDFVQKKKEEKVEEEDMPTDTETICPDCSQTIYGGYPAFMTHVRNVHNKWACQHCNKLFTQRCNMKRHENLHLSQKPFKCDKCERAFSRSSDLKNHMVKHENGGSMGEDNSTRDGLSPPMCPRCDQVFDNEETMRGHMYKQHRTSDDQWMCTICEQLFMNEETHEEHRLSHLSSLHQYKPAQQISDDDENTNDDQVMRDEYQRDLVIDESPQASGSQDESSNESAERYGSIKRALESNSTPSGNMGKRRRKGNPMRMVLTMDYSDEDAEMYVPLEVETVNASAISPKSVTSENDPLMNSYNSDVTKSMASHYNRNGDFELTNHLENLQSLTQAHSPLVIKPEVFPQRAGSDVLSPAQSPALHVMDTSLTPTQHTPSPQPLDPIFESKEYQCNLDDCCTTFVGFKAYEDHTLEAHKRFPCHLCKQTFSGKNNRTRHTRNHNKDKIYPCPECNKKFSRPDSMREHRFTHTLSYQEDRCRKCTQAFDKKSKLLAHLKTCFRQHRTKNGSIDESKFDESGMDRSMDSFSIEESPSGVKLAGMKLENNNESYTIKNMNGLSHDLPHPAAFLAHALVHATPPEAHSNSGTVLDLAKNPAQSPIDLAKSAPESPMDLASKHPGSHSSSPEKDDAHDSAKSSSDSTEPQGSPRSEASLSEIAENNNTGEKPMDITAAKMPAIRMLPTTIVETPQVGMV